MKGLALGSRAEHSARTREGLARARQAGKAVTRPSLVDDETAARIVAYRGRGESYRFIAEALNAARVPTPGGGPWYAKTVRDVYMRVRSRTNDAGDASSRKRCAATKRTGRACCLYAANGTEFCRYHQAPGTYVAPPRVHRDPTPPRRGADRKTDPWWQAIPAPLPAAEVARLRLAVGYDPSTTNERNA